MKKINEKGFTLVEVLVTIFIVSLVMGFSVVCIGKIIKNSKNQGNEVTINNLKSLAVDYIIENSDSISWYIESSDIEYTCVSMLTLVSYAGYSDDILEDNGIESSYYIKINRNRLSMNVVNEELTSVCS